MSHLTRRPGPNSGSTDVSHLIDGEYAYHSQRELRWHLAERFGLALATVDLRPAR